MSTADALGLVWAALDAAPGELARVAVTGDEGLLPTAFRVDALATACVAATLLAADGLRADAGAEPQQVTVDVGEAVASFASERHLRVDGTGLGDPWRGLSGDYRTRDGWVRLHCNFPHHQDAARSALGLPEDRDAAAARLRTMDALHVEQAVLAAGGAAAALRSADQWRASPAGRAAAGPPVVTAPGSAEPVRRPPAPDPARPLAGLRVLELTRVIAGPVAGRVLAALGAEVIHVRAGHLPTLPDLDLDTGLGKRAVLLDLRDAAARACFDRLLGGADVLVQSYRPGALERLGYGAAALRRARPGLVLAEVSAYGPDGPWAGRRGFDSLVQMATGIAAEGADRSGSPVPVPLPVQALDHATGWLAAAGALAALRRGRAARVHTSLARTAALLDVLGRRPHADAAAALDVSAYLTSTGLGDSVLTHVRMPGTIGGHALGWQRPPTPARPAEGDLDWER